MWVHSLTWVQCLITQDVILTVSLWWSHWSQCQYPKITRIALPIQTRTSNRKKRLFRTFSPPYPSKLITNVRELNQILIQPRLQPLIRLLIMLWLCSISHHLWRIKIFQRQLMYQYLLSLNLNQSKLRWEGILHLMIRWKLPLEAVSRRQRVKAWDTLRLIWVSIIIWREMKTSLLVGLNIMNKLRRCRSLVL